MPESALEELFRLGSERRRHIAKLLELDQRLPPLALRAQGEGCPVAVIATMVGLTRQRIYQVIEKEKGRTVPSVESLE